MKSKLVYISGGDKFEPAEVRAALDDIRRKLGLGEDTVLFGLPVDDPAETKADRPAERTPEPKVIQFPQNRRGSILSVIANPAVSAAPAPEMEPMPDAPTMDEFAGRDMNDEPAATFSDAPLVVSDEDEDDAGSITALFDKLPSMSEDEPPKPKTRSLADEFGEFLDNEEAEPQPEKKPRPFARRKNAFANVLGDLFSYAGIAANDDAGDFRLPDFIKRP